jgi:hypothetical protein
VTDEVIFHIPFSKSPSVLMGARKRGNLFKVLGSGVERHRWQRGAKAMAGTAAVSAVVLSGVLGVAVGASAAGSKNSLVVSGALSGTLVLSRTSTCDLSSTGGQLSGFSTSLSTKKYKNWSVTYQSAKLGTNMKFSSPPESFVLQSGLNGWVATSGTITVTASSAKVNLTLKNHEGTASGTVHVKGAWTCKNGVAAG